MDSETQYRLGDLADRVRGHFDSIEQDVPDQSYLVGGAVRDAVIGIESNDLDFVVIGETRETMEARGFEDIEASSFPVFHDSVGEEWALARTEQKTGDGYTGFDVETEDVTLEEDLNRRDLTMNSIAMNPRAGPIDPTVESEAKVVDVFGGEDYTLFDPNGGFEDIQDGVLRHVSDAFSEDPLRVMRTARYAGRFAVSTTEDGPYVRYEQRDGSAERDLHQFAFREAGEVKNGFEIHDKTMEMMRRVAPELNRMSRDRIGGELQKTLRQARRPSRAFEVLADSGALAVIWPELDRQNVIEAGPPEHHYESYMTRDSSLFTHTMMVLDRMHELCEEQEIEGYDRTRRLLMALAHDMGKVRIGSEKGGIRSDDPPVRFGGHAEEGWGMMESICRRLGLSTTLEQVMKDASAEHMRFHDLTEMSAVDVLEMLEDRYVDEQPWRGTLPHGSTRDSGTTCPVSFHGATAWELLDLAHADEEGRYVIEYTDFGKLSGQANGAEDGGATDAERVAFDSPEFDRESYASVVRAVGVAINSVDGYGAMIEGLCDEHGSERLSCPGGTNEIFVGEDETPIQSILESCESCRTPGSWIGDAVRQNRIEQIEDVIVDD